MTVELFDYRPVGDELSGTEQHAGQSHPGNDKDEDAAVTARCAGGSDGTQAPYRSGEMDLLGRQKTRVPISTGTERSPLEIDRNLPLKPPLSYGNGGRFGMDGNKNMDSRRSPQVSWRERGLALGSLSCGLLLTVAVVVFGVRNLGLLVLALVGLAVTVGGLWWVVTERMPRRGFGIAGGRRR